MEDYVEEVVGRIYASHAASGDLQKSGKMLGAILKNIQDKPAEAKYRKINRAKVEPKLAGAPGAFDLLEAIGFQNTGDGKLSLPEGSNLELLAHAVSLLDAQQQKLAFSLEAKQTSQSTVTSEEQAKRESELRKIQEENQAKIDALRTKKRKQKESSKQKFADARKEKEKEQINASVGKSLKFGRTQAVLPPAKKGG